MRSLLQKSFLSKATGLMLGLGLILSGSQAFAVTVTAKTGSGEWKQGNTWDTGNVPGATDDVVIPSTATVNVGKNTTGACKSITVAGNLVLDTPNGNGTAPTLNVGTGISNISGTVTIQDGTLNFANTSNVSFSNLSTVTFESTATGNIPAMNYNNLTINTTSRSLMGNTTVNGILKLSGASLTLGENNLFIGSGGSIAGVTSTNYLKLGTSGSLTIDNIGTSAVTFPIGTTTSYTPATISNSGTAQSFTVNVAAGVSGATNHVVNKTWNVSAGGATGTANATLTLQWNSATDLTTGFNSNASMINHFVNGAWETKGNTPTAATLVSTGVYSQTRSGITSFSPFAVGDNVSPLPVELVSFQAVKKDAAVVLNWETATEKNNKGFEVQASANGKTFETIAFVASQNGTANYSQRYAYTDKVSGKEGMMYYRLKQVDLDGTITFSSVKAVDLGRTSTVVTAFPNPFQNQFELSLQTSANQNATVIVTDLAGKIVYNATQTLQKGSNNLKVSLTNQPAGIYLIKATAGNQTYTNRLVKQ